VHAARSSRGLLYPMSRLGGDLQVEQPYCLAEIKEREGLSRFSLDKAPRDGMWRWRLYPSRFQRAWPCANDRPQGLDDGRLAGPIAGAVVALAGDSRPTLLGIKPTGVEGPTRRGK
jgi:hypothetical protein